MNTKIVSILGIDGAGKSSVSKILLHSPEFSHFSISVLTCPDYHLMPDKPYEKLSIALHNLNSIADKYQHRELKAVALYLHMTLFGPVEQFLIEKYHPRFIVTERHAIIDTLVYGIFYSKIVNTGRDNPISYDAILNEFREQYPSQIELINEWIEEENFRLKRKLRFWEIPFEISKLFTLNTEDLIREFSLHYRTHLPDIIIFIDVDPDIAIDRLRKSNEVLEMHEQKAVMLGLRESYLQLLSVFCHKYPEMKIINIKQDKWMDSAELTRTILKTW